MSLFLKCQSVNNIDFAKVRGKISPYSLPKSSFASSKKLISITTADPAMPVKKRIFEKADTEDRHFHRLIILSPRC